VAWRGVAWRGVAWRGAAWRGVAWRGAACDLVLRAPPGVLQHLGHGLGQPTRAPVRCFQRDTPLRFWASAALAEQLQAADAGAKPGPAPTVARQSPSGVQLSATEEPGVM
jgi:hypothetical protein